jgi:hypothetical protein
MEHCRGIRHFAPVFIVGIVDVAASNAVWHLMIASENRAFAQEFLGQANNQTIVLQNGIDD